MPRQMKTLDSMLRRLCSPPPVNVRFQYNSNKHYQPGGNKRQPRPVISPTGKAYASAAEACSDIGVSLVAMYSYLRNEKTGWKYKPDEPPPGEVSDDDIVAGSD